MTTHVHSSLGWTTIHGPTVTPDEASGEFFTATEAESLLLRWCPSCDGWAAPGTEICPRCPGQDLQWRAAAGTGELVTWTVVRNPPHPAFTEDMPIVSAIVELREGPWLGLRAIGPHSALRVGGPVEVGFAHDDEGATYPVAVLPDAQATS